MQSWSSSSGGRSTMISPSTPAVFRIIDEARDAVLLDRVEITHQDDRRLRILFAKTPHEFERLHRILPRFQRPQTRRLDRRAIGHRIGERHAEFDDIRPGFRQGPHHRERGFGIGIAGHDIGHERRAPLGAALRETVFDAAAHNPSPRCSATVKMSLSPRPHRLMIIR